MSHHPPISAGYVESEGFEIWMNTNMKTKFWGKSLEFKALGSINVRLKRTNDHFVILRPLSACHNIILGNMYIDHSGVMSVVNLTTSERCDVEFSKKGWFKKNDFSVKGKVLASNGRPAYELNGRWTDGMTIKNLESGEEWSLWQRNERPADWEGLYHFSYFTL